jgi:C1A family cysteine protease
MAELILPNGFGHGWRPQTPSHRDLRFRDHKPIVPITEDVSLREDCLPAVRDQGQFGSCTGHGSTAALMYSLATKGKRVALSARYAYWLGRLKEACVQEDSGCEIRDVIDQLVHFGAPRIELDPYGKTWPDMVKPPTKAAAKDALRHQVKTNRYLCSTVDEVLSAIKQGMGVVFGFTCFSNLDSGQLGHIPMPGPTDNITGGHCVIAVKGLVHDRYLKFQNSWTTSWGDSGYGYLPFDFINRGLASDMWAVEHE